MAVTNAVNGANSEIKGHPAFEFLHPLHVFIESMEAARELHRFIGDNISKLSDVEARFTAESVRRFPSDPEEQHSKAASLVHRNIHAIMDKHSEMEKDGASEAEIESARDKLRQDLRAQLHDLTGRPDYFARYGSVWSTVNSRKSGISILGSSLLINIVSDFEVLISGVVRAVLKMRPEVLRASKREFTYQYIEAFESIEAFRQHCAEKVAEELLRGGLDDWMTWFAKQKLEVPGVTDCPLELVEIFQRRHLLVHAGGVVNSIYLSKVGGMSDPPALGDSVQASGRYVKKSIELLLVAGIKLCISAARKFISTTDGHDVIDRDVSRISFNLLLREHYRIVESVNSWHVDSVADSQRRLSFTVNRWIALKKLKGTASIERSVEEWDTSTLSIKYKAVKLALLDRDEQAYQLVRKALDIQELSPDNLRDWPVFEGVRAYAVTRAVDAAANSDWLFDAPHRHGDPSPSSESPATPSE